MEIHENINRIITEYGMTKREFVRRVLDLSPRLKRTGEPPTEPTMYNYLNGQREIKLELLSYFAEVLNVSEIELLGINKKDRIKYLKRLAKSCTEEERVILQSLLSRRSNQDRAIKIFELLPYAPQHFQDEIIKVLESFKLMSEKFASTIKSK